MNDTEGHVDILVCMAGTGGTGFGTASYLRSRNPDLQVVLVQPRKRKKRKEKLMKEKKSRNLPNLNRETMWYMRITDLEFIRGLRKSK